MKVYIAGKITGLDPEAVKAKFARAEETLRNSNYNPVNPLKHVNSLASPREAMSKCIPLLMECDAILLLNDWEFSEGAKLELKAARYAQLRIIDEDELTQTS